jgi:hypothetical protein
MTEPASFRMQIEMPSLMNCEGLLGLFAGKPNIIDGLFQTLEKTITNGL